MTMAMDEIDFLYCIIIIIIIVKHRAFISYRPSPSPILVLLLKVLGGKKRKQINAGRSNANQIKSIQINVNQCKSIEIEAPSKTEPNQTPPSKAQIHKKKMKDIIYYDGLTNLL